jgi:hypothetical protein
MSATVSRLETRIAALFGYSGAVLFGRARSAVVALLEVLGGSRPFVMPSNVCPDLWLAVHRAQAAPIVLVAVDGQTGLPPDEAFVAAMACLPQRGHAGTSVRPGAGLPENHRLRARARLVRA